MSKVILYIAASLDGFIAGRNDDLSWLDAYQGKGEDYGYAEFISTVGTAVMGSRTYEQSLKMPELTIDGVRTYVLTERLFPVLPGAEVKFYSGNLAALLTRIREESAKNIWIVGGGQVVASFLEAGLIDEVQHFVIPVVLSEGIPLYPPPHRKITFNLIEASPYNTGVLRLRYIPGPKKSGIRS